jgi:RNA polymerase-binding protein DksA
MALRVKQQRARLDELRTRLAQDLERAREMRQANLPPPDEPSYSNHLADEGSATYQQEENLAVERHLSRELESVDAALARLAAGTYGKCENCGRPISPERLEALPTATWCMDCKSRQVQRR